MKPAFKRVLIKLSGELFAGDQNTFDVNAAKPILNVIKEVVEAGVEVAIVIGGGNILRGGRAAFGHLIDRATADTMGMLATIINGLALSDIFNMIGVQTHVLSSRSIDGVVEATNHKRACALLQQKKVVIFAGGTGNPFVTTDSTASLRACEIKADAILKVTTVDGVYDRDPKKDADAKRFEALSFDEALQKQLQVMDLAAFIQCRDFSIPICVFSMNEPQALIRVISGEKQGTWVRN
ncbi:UMP kinase [Facilibium subflavum]|uniref:UMP kinase n=1 Tax=Facilibium subflavum TaxID=2219058 RepID=UPI000E6474CA|nr:UMP kinase [Facilibium subflavum]